MDIRVTGIIIQDIDTIILVTDIFTHAIAITITVILITLTVIIIVDDTFTHTRVVLCLDEVITIIDGRMWDKL